MRSYSPRFDDPHAIDVARHRGLLSEDESFSQGIARVTRAVSDIDHRLGGADSRVFADQLSDALSRGHLGLSSQLFAGAGREGHVSACTVIRCQGVSDPSRTRSLIQQAAVASREGMGCGIDLTDLSDPVAALHDINLAVLDVHRELEAQNLRPPALMVTCDARHPRIAEFINAKADVDFRNWVANISVRFSDDAEWTRFRHIVAASAHRNGEPGVLFQDAADRDNPTPQYVLTSTAPCAEVFLSPGERCVFVSVNLAAHVKNGQFNWSGFAASVRLAVRAADAAVELAADGAAPVVLDRRRIGIGVCGFHTALIYLGVPYSAAIPLAQSIAERLVFEAHSASVQLAKWRGPFPAWEDSRWRQKEWLMRNANRWSGFVDRNDRAELTASILEDGIRNASVVAFPPTGVVAEILGVSRSYEPHYTLVGRTRASATTPLHIIPEAQAILAEIGDLHLAPQIMHPNSGHQLPSADSGHILACARQLPPEVHLGVHAAFCGLADESGSKTVNLPSDASIETVEALFEQARELGLKGLTVFRDKCLDRQGHKEKAA